MENFDIKKFFSYLKKYIVVFVVVLILSVGGTVLYDYHAKKPIYEAKATMVITRAGNGNSETVSTVTLNDINLNQKLVPEYSVVAKSDAVLGQVIEKLGLPDSTGELAQNITIKSILNTAAIDVFVEYGDAKMSAAIANSLVEAFSSEIKKLYGSDNIVQLSAAAEPSEPKNNTTTRDILVAAATSVMAALSVAFVRFYLDNNIKDDDETEKTLNLPVVGRISKDNTDAEKIVSDLRFMAVNEPLKIILVARPKNKQDGDAVLMALAKNYAKTGKSVLLVDCDLRNNGSSELFGISEKKDGLSDLLVDEVKNHKKYIYKTSIDGVSVITRGSSLSSPNELFVSKKAAALFRILKTKFDVILLKGAPVDEFSGSMALSKLADGTIIVARDSKTSIDDLVRVRDMLRKVGAKILGVVFDNIKK